MWIHCDAYFDQSSEGYSEMMNLPPQMGWSPFSFNTDDMVAFNKSTKDGCATVRLKSGFDITISVSYSELMSTIEDIELDKINDARRASMKFRNKK